jgi:hypothetical protein
MNITWQGYALIVRAYETITTPTQDASVRLDPPADPLLKLLARELAKDDEVDEQFDESTALDGAAHGKRFGIPKRRCRCHCRGRRRM